MNYRSTPSMFAALLVLSGTVRAHHSYAVFESAKEATVVGTVAKLEWTNPHVFIWVYVPRADDPASYDLYAFENGSPNALEKSGWSKTLPKAGDRIAVTYAPLRDGRKGGHWIIGTLADGRALRGAGAPASRNVPAPAAPASP